MKSLSIHFALSIALVIILLGHSCTGSSSSSAPMADTVTVAQVKMSDTTSFKKSNGDLCAIYADATFSYPTAYVDQSSLLQLQQLYATIVLGAPDTITPNEAMRQCVANSLHQYDFATPGQDAGNLSLADADDLEAASVYHTSTNVQLHYNRNALVTFCRVDVVKKDSVVTSVTHRYYTIDLEQMRGVEVKDLFRDDALSEVTRLLKARLLEQNKVENNEQLNELGYFNVDNLVATSNFYFDANGVTWSYQPNELAVSAVGEPCITLAYDVLMPLASDNSILRRIQ